MHTRTENSQSKRRSINLTISEDVIKTAKSLKLNASKAAEVGIQNAIKKAQEQQWLAENRDSLQAHNKRIEKFGTLLTPDWALEE